MIHKIHIMKMRASTHQT